MREKDHPGAQVKGYILALIVVLPGRMSMAALP